MITVIVVGSQSLGVAMRLERTAWAAGSPALPGSDRGATSSRRLHDGIAREITSGCLVRDRIEVFMSSDGLVLCSATRAIYSAEYSERGGVSVQVHEFDDAFVRFLWPRICAQDAVPTTDATYASSAVRERRISGASGLGRTPARDRQSSDGQITCS